MCVTVSVITPNYNSADFISEAIQSVIAQSFKDWEMIVVDDCSTDNSVEIINDIVRNHPKIRFIQLTDNVGAAKSRNIALNEASGRFIAFLDSDDVWHPDKLTKQVGFMLENNVGISFTSYEPIDQFGKRKSSIIHSESRLTQSDYLKNTIIGFSTSMIDTLIVGRDFRMRDMRVRQDASLWISLLGKGFVAEGLDVVLSQYRVHKGSISSNKLKSSALTWTLYYRIHKLGFFRSVYYFLWYVFSAVKKRL